MSIALSAIVRPSRTARRLLAAWALAQCCAAATVLATPARFAAPAWLAGVLGSAGLALGCAAARSPKTHRIDVSGTGELRVTVQQSVHPARLRATAAVGPAAVPSVLLPGSVVCPGLIVLRLGAGHDGPRVVSIWRDGVDGDTWRALTVALGVVGKAAGPDGRQRRDRQDGGFERHR